MKASILFISQSVTEKGLIKEIEAYLRINRNMAIHFKLVDEMAEAYNRLAETKYDLIILDMDILTGPVMATLTKIKEKSEAVLMVITDDISEETGILALENGADDIEYKPLRQIEFLLKVSNLVRMHVYQSRLEEEKDILKQFVSEEIADHVINEQSSSGIKTFASIMFFDIRNSTMLAETVSPFELANLLNDVINDVIDIIYKNLGSVNNILGDGILATFGYPVVYDHDAVRAVRCIHDIRHLFATKEFSIPIQYGVGVTTGSMFSGNIGNSHKMSNTVLGDPVNLAARLQEMTKRATKASGSPIDAFIDEMTYESAKAYLTVQRYKGHVRGKAEHVQVFYPNTIDITAIDNDLKATNEIINNNISEIGDVDFF